MNVTQKNIADHLRVSRSLVGDALRGDPRISVTTRARVAEAARQLGYDEGSNAAARKLIAQRYGNRMRTGVLGVIVPWELETLRDETATMHNSSFFSGFIHGIQWQAGMMEMDVHLFNHNHGPGTSLPRSIREGEVDGVISLDPGSGWMEQFGELELPTVSILARQTNTHSLLVDDIAGVREAVLHLAGLGHHRIAYLGQTGTPVAAARLEGYRLGHKATGLAVWPELLEADLPGIGMGADGMARLMARSRDFSALVCYNDELAMSAVQALQKAGLRVPDDVSVVGFDDTSVQNEFRPALTSVSYSRMAMGRRAVEIVMEHIGHEQPSTVPAVLTHEVFPVTLAVRESTAARRHQ